MRKVITIVVLCLAMALAGTAAAQDQQIKSQWNSHIIATWQCEDHLTGQRTKLVYSPWKPHNTSFREAQRDKWKDRSVRCSQALQEKKRQWNWQSSLPQWALDLARCESSYNWWAEATSTDGSFYSAFNISRGQYDKDAHHMGVRGWNEGRGVPSPVEQTWAVIGHMRLVGDGFAGNCHGIAQRTW